MKRNFCILALVLACFLGDRVAAINSSSADLFSVKSWGCWLQGSGTQTFVDCRYAADPEKKLDEVPGPFSATPKRGNKWALWTDGPHLRGANIYQRRVYPELDGPSFLGPGPVGPPYTQEDLNRLAALGANYVNISHPGLFTESPPYVLDPDIRDNLDNLLNMVAEADMFAVISFRTGPGRSEFTFFCDEVGDWFDASYLNDSMWQDQTAQDAWAAMLGVRC